MNNRQNVAENSVHCKCAHSSSKDIEMSPWLKISNPLGAQSCVRGSVGAGHDLICLDVATRLTVIVGYYLL